MTLLPFFGRYSHFKFRFFSKMSNFLRFSHCRIIIAKLLIFKTSDIVKNTFTMVQVRMKLVTMTLLSFFGRYFHFKFQFFSKMYIFHKFFNCRINIAQTTYFENIKYCKIYFHYGIRLTKTSYNDFASFFWKIFPFQISIYFKNVNFSQVFKLPHNQSPNYLF